MIGKLSTSNWHYSHIVQVQCTQSFVRTHKHIHCTRSALSNDISLNFMRSFNEVKVQSPVLYTVMCTYSLMNRNITDLVS